VDKNPIANIYEIIRNLEVIPHKNRQEFFCMLIESLVKGRSVIFSEMAYHMNLAIKEKSKERRIQDFFYKVEFNYLALCKLLCGFIPHQEVILSIDRTNWKHGNQEINVLCVVVVVGKMGIPVYYELLDNHKGNSKVEERISVLKSVIEVIGIERISCLVMDREFIGQSSLSWLQRNKVNFVVRVPKHHQVILQDGIRCEIQDLLQEHSSYIAHDVIVDGVNLNLSVSYTKKGELLFLIGTLPANQLKSIYRKRWSIETVFQAFKERGFNIERSGLRDLNKYKKLIALVAIAYTLCWATGIQHGKTNPVKRKKHNYPQNSVFRRGVDLLRAFYKQKIVPAFIEAVLLAKNKIFVTG